MDIAQIWAELRWQRKFTEKNKLFAGKMSLGTKEENDEMICLECSSLLSET